MAHGLPRPTANRQALLVLAHLRCGDTHARLAAGLGIGVATLYRRIREAADAPAALAPTLAQAMNIARTKAFVLLDGTLPPTCRSRWGSRSSSARGPRTGK